MKHVLAIAKMAPAKAQCDTITNPHFLTVEQLRLMVQQEMNVTL